MHFAPNVIIASVSSLLALSGYWFARDAELPLSKQEDGQGEIKR
jgi:hypothetical protein